MSIQGTDLVRLILIPSWNCYDLLLIFFETLASYFAEDFEPQPSQVASIAACQAWAMPLEGYGVHYFVFDGITEECMLYSTLQVRMVDKRLIKLQTYCYPPQNSYYSCVSQPFRLTAA